MLDEALRVTTSTQDFDQNRAKKNAEPDQSTTPAFNLESIGRTRRKLVLEDEQICMSIDGLNLHYGNKQALFDVSLKIPKQRVTAFIGPSGCGKSTLLRSMNRMNDLVEGCKIDGKIILDDSQNIYEKGVNVSDLRRRVGMVFQKPNPFPKTIYENVAYGLRIQGINKKTSSG